MERSAVTIISEGSRRIPEARKALGPTVTWQDLAGIGKVLRHDYQTVAVPIVCNVVTEHLSPLEAAVLWVLDRQGCRHLRLVVRRIYSAAFSS